MAYVIKQPGTKRFLVKEEDSNFVTFNFTYDKKAATTFQTEELAREVRDEAMNNASEQLKQIRVNRNIDVLEQESLSEFLTLNIVSETKL